MRHSIKTLILAVLALFHGALLAQDSSDEDPHAALALAFTSKEIALLRFEQDMKISFSSGFKQIPELVEVDKDCPGYFLGLTKAMRPVMFEGHMEDNTWYQNQLEKLFRSRLSKQDAAGAAQFYSSDDGQNLLAQAIASMAGENTVAEIVENIDEERPLSAQAYAADQEATTERLLRSMSQEELVALGTRLQGEKWFPKFLALTSEIQALGLEMFNRDYSPEIEAKIDTAIEGFTDAHLGACEAYR